jgi:DNA-binding MarR family transcriptional regulator
VEFDMASPIRESFPDPAEFGPLGRRTGVRLSCAHLALMSLYSAALETLRLTPSRVLALAFVLEHPGCDQTSLSRALAVNRASAMTLVDRLEELDYLRRAPGPDRRSNALYATDHGAAALERAQELGQEGFEQVLFGWMDGPTRDAFHRTLDQILASAKAAGVPEGNGQPDAVLAD